MSARSDRERETDQFISRRRLLQQIGRYSTIVAGAMVASRAFADDDDMLLLMTAVLSKKPPFYEDFETGNFTKYPWRGWPAEYLWFITTAQPHEGSYCAKSCLPTTINTCSCEDPCISELWVSVQVPKDSTISFYLKLSSTEMATLFQFYIDQELQQEWWSTSSDWVQYTYDVSAGAHVFSWLASQCGSSLLDAFLDDISITAKPPWSGDWSGDWSGNWSGNTHVDYGDWNYVWSGDWY